LKLKGNTKAINESLEKKGVICDFRYPDIIRVAPIPQYTSYLDVYRFVEILMETVGEQNE